MKCLIVIISLISLSTCALPAHPLIEIIKNQFYKPKFVKQVEPNPAIDAEIISQRVNPFNPQDLRRFNQLYLTNDEFFQPGGPIIIFLYQSPVPDGISELYLFTGPVHSLAEGMHGHIVIPYQRYSPYSHVFEELTTENLQFLTTAHVLDDYANLIRSLKSTDRFRNSSVIVVGWSYGGTVAVLMRQKYPHLVDAVWASGAKLMPTLNNVEPVQVVERGIRQFGGEECAARIQNGLREIDEMILTNNTRQLRRTFSLCFPLPFQSGDMDLWFFKEYLVSYFESYTLILSEQIIQNDLCEPILRAEVQNDFEAIAQFLGFDTIPPPLCFPINYPDQIDIMNIDSIPFDSETASYRAFFYQQCTEFGFFFNEGDRQSILGELFPTDFFVRTCMDVFGFTREQMESNYARFNVVNGGRNPAVRNTYFTYGQFDTNSYQGADRNLVHNSSEFEMIYDRGLFTEMNLFFDDPQFAEVKRRVFSQLSQWIGIEIDSSKN